MCIFVTIPNSSTFKLNTFNTNKFSLILVHEFALFLICVVLLHPWNTPLFISNYITSYSYLYVCIYKNKHLHYLSGLLVIMQALSLPKPLEINNSKVQTNNNNKKTKKCSFQVCIYANQWMLRWTVVMHIYCSRMLQPSRIIYCKAQAFNGKREHIS